MVHIELVKGYLQKGLVKPGLDYNLLKEVRREIEEHGNAEDCDEDLLEKEYDQIEALKPVEQLPSNIMVRKTCEILFPSATLQQKQRERRNELFGEKRMAYVVDLDDEAGGDIPSTLIRSRAGCPAINQAKVEAEEDLHRKCVLIMAAMRRENGDAKKRQQTFAVDLVSNSHHPTSANQKVFEDVDDYSPNDLKPLRSGQSSHAEHREEASYFNSEKKLVDGGAYCRRGIKSSEVGIGSSIGERNRMAENETGESKRHMIEDNRFKRRRLEREDDAYAELYPVNIGFLEAAGESDEEDDFSKMNLGSSKALVKRCDFDDDNDLEKHQESRETVPKAAFQRGLKANGGKKTGKNAAAGENKKLNKEMDKISKILDERKNKSGS